MAFTPVRYPGGTGPCVSRPRANTPATETQKAALCHPVPWHPRPREHSPSWQPDGRAGPSAGASSLPPRPVPRLKHAWRLVGLMPLPVTIDPTHGHQDWREHVVHGRRVGVWVLCGRRATLAAEPLPFLSGTVPPRLRGAWRFHPATGDTADYPERPFRGH